MSQPQRRLKFGVLSPATIAGKVVNVMHSSQYVEPIAVASRDLSRAKAFSEKFNIPRVYGSYEELLTDNDVEAIYFPIPTALRFNWVAKAARAKKHVLVEKPFLNAQEVREMIKICEENGVHFMDNTMWLHNTRTKVIKANYLNNGFILNRVHNNFSFNTMNNYPNDVRFNIELEPNGALGDLGWYCIGQILWAYDFELPVSVLGKGYIDPLTGALLDCSCILNFSKHRTATFDCSLRDVTRQSFELVGADKLIRCDGFVVPFENEPYIWKRESYEPRAKFTVYNGVGDSEVVQVEPCDQALCLLEQFAKDSATPDSCAKARYWGQQSVKVMVVLDALVQSIKEEGTTIFLSGSTEKVLMVGQ